ncbi:MAG TPA: hypothetical protein VNI52_03450 [Sphingobacteriaceae bacterium]|nr:hypothetical protein [Sphingobacteriaceae bacterium]
MKIFKNAKEKGQTSTQDAVAQKIAGRIVKFQFKIADYLNEKTAHYSKVQKEILLIVISALFSAASLYLIFNSINYL